MLLYFHILIFFGEELELKDIPSVSVRNRVIHNAEIPSRKDSMQYGQEVYNLMLRVFKKFKENMQDELYEHHGKIIQRYHEAEKKEKEISKTGKVCKISGYSFSGLLNVAEILCKDGVFTEAKSLQDMLETRKYNPLFQNTPLI